ncbi:hypothetical protein [Helicobacter salomonis]|nr:hypothetical protein [Helicobacter salomonis]
MFYIVDGRFYDSQAGLSAWCGVFGQCGTDHSSIAQSGNKKNLPYP